MHNSGQRQVKLLGETGETCFPLQDCERQASVARCRRQQIVGHPGYTQQVWMLWIFFCFGFPKELQILPLNKKYGWRWWIMVSFQYVSCDHIILRTFAVIKFLRHGVLNFRAWQQSSRPGYPGRTHAGRATRSLARVDLSMIYRWWWMIAGQCDDMWIDIHTFHNWINHNWTICSRE